MEGLDRLLTTAIGIEVASALSIITMVAIDCIKEYRLMKKIIDGRAEDIEENLLNYSRCLSSR